MAKVSFFVKVGVCVEAPGRIGEKDGSESSTFAYGEVGQILPKRLRQPFFGSAEIGNICGVVLCKKFAFTTVLSPATRFHTAFDNPFGFVGDASSTTSLYTREARRCAAKLHGTSVSNI